MALNRWGRWLRAITALTVLAALVGGVPWLLATVAGWPLDWIGWPAPGRPPGVDDLLATIATGWSDTQLLAVLATGGWLLWAQFCRHILMETIEAAAALRHARRGHPRPASTSGGPLRLVAAILVGAVAGAILLDTLGAGVGQPQRAAAAPPRPATVALAHPNPASVSVTSIGPTVRQVSQPEVPAWARDAPGGYHRATSSEGLPDIAQARLGDPDRWREIYVLSRGHLQPDGQALTDPAVIQPGWFFALPAATPTTAAASPAGTVAASTVTSTAIAVTVGPMYQVERRDWMWHIADRYLGDPLRYQEIEALNPQLERRDGRFPDHIEAGWMLRLPADAQDRGERPHATGHRVSDPRPPTDQPAGDPPTPGTDTPAEPVPLPTVPTPSPSSTVTPTAPPSSSPASQTPTPAATAAPGSAAPGTTTPQTSPASAGDHAADQRDQPAAGINMPAGGWVSLGLAAVIAALAAMLRLQRRRHARQRFPIPITSQPVPDAVPDTLAPAEAAGARHLAQQQAPDTDDEDIEDADGVPQWALPAAPSWLPLGIDAHGQQLGLPDLPRPGLALRGTGAEPAARAVVASALASAPFRVGHDRPVVITTTATLARLLPDGAALVGIDPQRLSFDGERLVILPDTAAAVAETEAEVFSRHRRHDTDDTEPQPPWVLLIDADQRHSGRLQALAQADSDLHLYPVVLGTVDGLATLDIEADGTLTTPNGGAAPAARLSTLAASDLAHLLAMATETAARAEIGTDIDTDPPPPLPTAESVEPIPTPPEGTAPPVRLSVLGPVTLSTDAGPITTGLRSSATAVLALLAAHPSGRTLDQIVDQVFRHTVPGDVVGTARAGIASARKALRDATGQQAMFIRHDPATGLYRIDPDLITVDLWQMLDALQRANHADTDEHTTAALREAIACYHGDFAERHDGGWATGYATSYRDHAIAAHARIAEILETDHPDQAIEALEQAIILDPVNEELHQRLMRIHGRLRRTDALTRTMRQLETRLFELGGAEPSEATRRLYQRQLDASSVAVRR